MFIVVEPGNRLTVRLAGTDGEFTIDFDYDSRGTLEVKVDLPDDDGREGIIYKETFSRSDGYEADEGSEE